MSESKYVFVDDEQSALLPLWREAFMGAEWLALRTKPLYYGFGVPRGNGSAVITVPGFLGSDRYLREMNLWLKRIGYRPYPSDIGRNAECPDILVDRLLLTIDRAHSETRRRVHLIGHSLGGVLARAAAVLASEKILSVTTLASPFRGMRSHPSVALTGREVRRRIARRAHTRPPDKPLRQHCFTGRCNCDFAEAVRLGIQDDLIDETAVYTKTDGVVDWSVCITGKSEVDVEVKGTHCGLAWNAEVYRLVADRLSRSERSASRFAAQRQDAEYRAASFI